MRKRHRPTIIYLPDFNTEKAHTDYKRILDSIISSSRFWVNQELWELTSIFWEEELRPLLEALAGVLGYMGWYLELEEPVDLQSPKCTSRTESLLRIPLERNERFCMHCRQGHRREYTANYQEPFPPGEDWSMDRFLLELMVAWQWPNSWQRMAWGM